MGIGQGRFQGPDRYSASIAKGFVQADPAGNGCLAAVPIQRGPTPVQMARPRSDRRPNASWPGAPTSRSPA